MKKIIAGTSIKKMKQRAKQYGGLAHSAWKGEKGEKFFRKGTIGDYKNYFSPDILNFFNNEAKEEFAKFNYL